MMRCNTTSTCFEKVWRSLGCAPRASWYREMVRQYSQSLRGYHVMRHIEHTLKELLHAPRSLLAEPYLVTLALWYHDVVYVPGRSDNEERSAELFLRHARQAGLAKHARMRVVTLIRYTKEHAPPQYDMDAMLVCDSDCAILGASWRAFMRYERGIRKEYMRGMGISRAVYDGGRRAFLEHTLARTSIFLSPSMAARYEMRARRNISRLLEVFE